MKAFGNRGGMKNAPAEQPSPPRSSDSNQKLPDQRIAAVPPSEALRPSQPIDPTNHLIGDERFGYWEDVDTPFGPFTNEGPPPLGNERRKFPNDPGILEEHTAKPTDWFVPNKSWIGDTDAPYYQLQEQYRFRISGTEATPYSRIVDNNGTVQQQRWVQYTYEVQHGMRSVLSGPVEIGKVKDGDLAGVPSFPAQGPWTPMPINEIAALSARNPETKFFVPDGCGKQFTYAAGVPTGGWSSLPPSPPIMTRPR